MRLRVDNVSCVVEIEPETPEEGIQIGSFWDQLCRSGVRASINDGTKLRFRVVADPKVNGVEAKS